LCGGFEKEVSGGPLVAAGALDHEDGDHACLGVDGEVGAVGSVVAEPAVAEVAEAVVDLGFAGLFCSQFVHSGVRQVAVSVEFAVVGQHQAVAEDVVRGGEQAAAGFGVAVSSIAVWLGQEEDASWNSDGRTISIEACRVNGTPTARELI
jgi:hypothetical protein